MSALAAALLVLFPALSSPPPVRIAGTRTEAAGWVTLRLSGSPREIGREYGRLAAPEIVDAHIALKDELKRTTGKEWTWFRDEARRMFWPKVDLEYQEEIIGQAEGLRAAGHAIDQWDVLAFNGHIELEGYYLPWLQDRASDKTACSAFVATGSATSDGKIVMGHNLWWGYRMGQRWNLILDIKPEKGERIVMDALAGFIHSGSDFAINSAGLMICETTISGFKGFDPEGIPCFVRMRKATQYAKSLDEWVAIMRRGNNGGYANTWLLGDRKTNEIGKLELGLKNVIFSRASEGYYVGSNFPEDPKLIREEIPGGWDPSPQKNSCETRRLRWNQLLTENIGRVDAEKGKAFLADTIDAVTKVDRASDRTLCGISPWGGAVNTKVTTSALAENLTFWARMGVSNGAERRFNLPNRPGALRDIPSQPWILWR